MSEDIRKMIDKVKNFKQFVNEQQNVENNLNNNFRMWFSGSKVVYGGKPLPVYHGSHNEFDEFMGDSYFTDDYMNADGYAGGEYVYEVYLSIKRPLVVDCQDRKWDDIDTPYGTTTHMVVSSADRNKYDGVIFINIKDSWIDDVDYQDAGTIYATFKPNQIKSVDNDGTWDINDDNIYS
jgi:ADP-Ribosyltransferase in polyvalent proteins